jgi:hypothetical protein
MWIHHRLSMWIHHHWLSMWIHHRLSMWIHHHWLSMWIHMHSWVIIHSCFHSWMHHWWLPMMHSWIHINWLAVLIVSTISMIRFLVTHHKHLSFNVFFFVVWFLVLIDNLFDNLNFFDDFDNFFWLIIMNNWLFMMNNCSSSWSIMPNSCGLNMNSSI